MLRRIGVLATVGAVAVLTSAALTRDGGTSAAPVVIQSFYVGGCGTDQNDIVWGLNWTVTGSTGGTSWEVRSTEGASDNPANGWLASSGADVAGGPELQYRDTEAYYSASETPHYRYLWLRYSGDSGPITAWYPLAENALNVSECLL